jgi:filamentous hemagglutinin
MSQVKMTPTGTYLSDLKQLIQQNGVNVRGNPSTTIDDIKYGTRNGKPAIVEIKLPGGRHAVVVDGITTRNGIEVVAVRDPWGTQYFEPVISFKEKIGYGAIFIRQ